MEELKETELEETTTENLTPKLLDISLSNSKRFRF